MSRLEKLQESMAIENVDLVVLGPGPHMKWLMGFYPHPDERPCFVCISLTKAAFLMPALNAEGSVKYTDLPFFTWTDADGPDQALEQLFDLLKVASARSIVIDETMRADFAALIQRALPNASSQFTATTIGRLRMKKDDEEYQILKQNAYIADHAMRAGWAAMRAGMLEEEVGVVIREKFKEMGARPLFDIVGTGLNGAFPHHQTGATRLASEDAVVMDIGGTLGGYSSDITRMAAIGNPPDGYEEVHAIVEAAVQAALKAAKPGVRAHEVDDAARRVIAEAGYGKYFVHRTGHGMGVEVHEQPYITSSSKTVLESGMVFSVEPGIYLPGRFGIRLEDIVILRDEGPETLSELPRNLQVI